jgi:cytochrome c553
MHARMNKFCHLHFVIAVIFPLASCAHELKSSHATTVCAACHGANGVSVAEHIPNLAGQKPAYLVAQLSALKDGSRKSEVMNPIAAQLSDADISSAAAHFSSQPGPTGKINSPFLPNFVKTRVSFPANYKTAFTRYLSLNDIESNRVKYYYANDAASRAARRSKSLPDGAAIFVEIHAAKLDANNKPIKDGNGFFVPDKLLAYSAMSRDAGWAADIPEMLRNENWQYAIFTKDGQLRNDQNHAECFACHKSRDTSSHVFTLKQLAAARDD